MGVTQPARGLAALQPAVYELCGPAVRQNRPQPERTTGTGRLKVGSSSSELKLPKLPAEFLRRCTRAKWRKSLRSEHRVVPASGSTSLTAAGCL